MATLACVAGGISAGVLFSRRSCGKSEYKSILNPPTTIDLIHDAHNLCTRLRTDGIKAMSRGFSVGKQVINFSNTRNHGRVCLFLTTENEQIFILKTIMENKGGWKLSLLRHSKLIGSVSGEIFHGGFAAFSRPLRRQESIGAQSRQLRRLWCQQQGPGWHQSFTHIKHRAGVTVIWASTRFGLPHSSDMGFPHSSDMGIPSDPNPNLNPNHEGNMKGRCPYHLG